MLKKIKSNGGNEKMIHEPAKRISRNCVFCGGFIDPQKFKDRLSEKEYQISGLCQKCQDETFKEPEK